MSNVRRYDTSCQKCWTSNDKIYKCKTCDASELLFICEDCFKDGNHSQHNYKSVIANKDGFCNCGDLTGLIKCDNHTSQNINNKTKPLHVNHEFLKEFSAITCISINDSMNLAYLNQIRKIYYKSNDGKLITEYIENSSDDAVRKFFIKRSYSVYRKDHEIRFVDKGFDKQRRVLLWHGTKCANLNGILTNGFILPKKMGNMFGNGIYFADRVMKSSHYCDSKGPRFFFLCEVALGSMWRTTIAKTYTAPPSNINNNKPFNSIKGKGSYIPDVKGAKKFDNNIIVPCGLTIQDPKIKYPTLNFNEFIVFDVERILIKFIVQCEWE